MDYRIRNATAADEQTLVELMPRLADFAVPQNRNPQDLWQGDARLLKKALTGEAPDTHTLVAENESGVAIAIAMYTLKAELISNAASAHLEALAVHPDHARQGIGKQLITACSDAARQQGAVALSLHVFANNSKARALYNNCGFDEEIIRCYKSL